MSLEMLADRLAPEEANLSAEMADLLQGHEALSHLLEDVFSDLESLGTEVEVRVRMLDEIRMQAAEQSAELKTLRQAESQLRAELMATQHEMQLTEQQFGELPEESHQLRNQLHALEIERCGLETELEALRVRTAELTDHLSEVKRQTAEERIEWSSELKQLRRTLERQAELLADRLATPHVVERVVAYQSPDCVAAAQSMADTVVMPVVSVPAIASKDAVLGSVMAQFEMLQRDRQRRRTTS